MSREKIHYWKCDRPAAFHGTAGHSVTEDLPGRMQSMMESLYPGQPVSLIPGGGQGNHRTFLADIGPNKFFIRIEDGPEHDIHLQTESRVQEAVRTRGIPAPRIFAADAGRTRVPFAWQVMEAIPHPDLNHWHKAGVLDIPGTFRQIGTDIARWQALPVSGFGPFKPEAPGFQGYHATYADYFRLNLETHFQFLIGRQFLSNSQADEMRRLIEDHAVLLDLPGGCLVHKDLALWNILGESTRIAAYIDWDDAISGDEMDDLSLLGCFHPGRAVSAALAGYASVKPLPAEHRRRFWLHLLRNMIVKSVIRVGAGYFEKTDGFFLIGSGSSGQDLRNQTHARLQAAMTGLHEDRDIATL